MLRILSTSITFRDLTGMPMFLVNLGRGIVKLGHEFVITSPQMGGAIVEKAKAAGAICVKPEEVNGDFDAVFAQEAQYFNLFEKYPFTPTWNYLHSMNEIDKPAKHSCIVEYLAPRMEVAMKWAASCGSIGIMPIPVDFERFKPKEAENHGNYKILLPCTTDRQRMPMLLTLVERCIKEPNTVIRQFGDDHGALEKTVLPPNFTCHPATNDIEKEMAWCDEVAGIHIGTVTLEAWAMGKKTSVWDLHGKFEMVEPYENFRDWHDPQRIAKELLNKMQ